jgi:hypothetical protein
VQFAVGFRVQGKTEHVVVDAEDALIAALKVKIKRPDVLIAYVRQQNKRGDHTSPYAATQQRELLGCACDPNRSFCVSPPRRDLVKSTGVCPASPPTP